MSRIWDVVRGGVTRFIDDECLVRGASLAYYTIFSLPPLLVIVFLVAEWGGASAETVDRFARKQIGIPVPASPEGTASLTAVAERASVDSNVGWLARIFGLGVLVLSATGVVAQLQDCLNRAWDVEVEADGSAWWRIVVKRMLSLAMVVAVGLVLLVSLALSAILDDVVEVVANGSPADLGLAIVLNVVLGYAVATLVFAAVFKILPDAEIAWRHVWLGALFTALLFTLGKGVVGWHLRSASGTSPWGAAAGSMVAMLVWVYYTSLIVLFGAEVTRAWVDTSTEQHPRPEKGAVVDEVAADAEAADDA